MWRGDQNESDFSCLSCIIVHVGLTFITAQDLVVMKPFLLLGRQIPQLIPLAFGDPIAIPYPKVYGGTWVFELNAPWLGLNLCLFQVNSILLSILDGFHLLLPRNNLTCVHIMIIYADTVTKNYMVYKSKYWKYWL